MRKRWFTALAVGAVSALAASVPASAVQGPRNLYKLANEQTQVWLNSLPSHSPVSGACVRSGTDSEVVLLPEMTPDALVVAPSPVSCSVSRHDELLLDLGGSVLTQDAHVCTEVPDPCYPVNGVDKPFTPGNLDAIATQILADFGPFGSATLDGRVLRSRPLVTPVFTATIPLSDPKLSQYTDSEAVGTPGFLATNYAGSKVLIDGLGKGRHTIVETNRLFGVVITYQITVS